MGQRYSVSVASEVYEKVSFHRSFAFRLAGHIHTVILADTT